MLMSEEFTNYKSNTDIGYMNKEKHSVRNFIIILQSEKVIAS